MLMKPVSNHILISSRIFPGSLHGKCVSSSLKSGLLQGGKKTPGVGKGRKRKADEGASQAQLQLAGLLQLMSQLEHDLVSLVSATQCF